MNVTLSPVANPLAGSIDLPPSKAMSHRVLFAGALSDGESSVDRILISDDTMATANAVTSLGAAIRYLSNKLSIRGIQQTPNSAMVACGDSGATLRLAVPIAAALRSKVRFLVSQGLTRRPLEPLVAALREISPSEIAVRKNEVIVDGKGIDGGETAIHGNVSSQFISGLLFASPFASSDVRIRIVGNLESKHYVELTRHVLESHAIESRWLDGMLVTPGGQRFRPNDHNNSSDLSAGSFLLGAAAITGGHLQLDGLISPIEPDYRVIELMRLMGQKVRVTERGVEIEGGQIDPLDLDLSQNPDLVPPAAAVACYGRGETRIQGISRLRYKESNRAETIVTELRKMGARINSSDNELLIDGGKPLKGAVVDSHSDHRIAMSLAIAGLRAYGKSTIVDGQCVAKSYPNFFGDLAQLGVDIDA